MNFLQLCRRLREEAGISGNGPMSVTGQTGEMKRLVNWIGSAWEDIQRMRQNWRWMRGSFQFTTTNGDYDYSPSEAGIAQRFRSWDRNTFRVYYTTLGVSNQRPIDWIPYLEFQKIYLTGPVVTGAPICFSIAPDNKLLIGPFPDGQYTITGDYWKSNQTLTIDSDTPEMPTEYHEYIVYRALEKYGLYESASEVVMRAKEEQRHYKRTLEANQLPFFDTAGPVA